MRHGQIPDGTETYRSESEVAFRHLKARQTNSTPHIDHLVAVIDDADNVEPTLNLGPIDPFLHDLVGPAVSGLTHVKRVKGYVLGV